MFFGIYYIDFVCCRFFSATTESRSESADRISTDKSTTQPNSKKTDINQSNSYYSKAARARKKNRFFATD
jgi:hypothetical protein